ncbi:MAG: methyl-accepting chemotaxis protein [Pseudomonadota bacterium]
MSVEIVVGLSDPMDLRKKCSLYFAATAFAAVVVTIAFQLLMPGAGGAILLAPLFATALGACFGYVFGRSLSSLLHDLKVVIVRLTKWQTDGEVPHTGRRDAIGGLAIALDVFQTDAANWKESHQSEQDSQIEGRLAAQRRTEELIHQFRGSIAGLLGGFAESARQMYDTARLLSSVATDTNDRVGVVASASDEASANVQSVAATAEELAVSCSDIGARVSKASIIVDQVTENAHTANQKVQSLTNAAERIGNVVDLIQDVAAQSNLLALNATIEAARAGEAGRGFAVVAREVKTLADQTAKATEDIKKQIDAVRTSTQSAVEAMQSIVTTMGDVNQNTQDIAGAVQQQSAATSEISQSVRQAARGTEDVAAHMPDVTKAVDDTNQSAAQMLQVSKDLSRHGEQLRHTVENFLRRVAAADALKNAS